MSEWFESLRYPRDKACTVQAGKQQKEIWTTEERWHLRERDEVSAALLMMQRQCIKYRNCWNSPWCL